MCLAVPGRIVELLAGADDVLRMGRVDFGGVMREVCLAYIDEPRVDEYVLVHVGFAISRVSEAEADRIFDELDALGEVLCEEGGR